MALDIAIKKEKKKEKKSTMKIVHMTKLILFIIHTVKHFLSLLATRNTVLS